MKYLLQAIEARREHIRLNDPELRRLLTDVRQGRDEREEFLESIDRILTELRNYTEHSQAFLNRVSKREAPDYYDVIKHPMDLSTMQKKVKTGSYKNKKQFAHDLDLIWDNCLTYNSDPSHPLRRSVQFMRKKANHLLDFISDKSEVKDVLEQWAANEKTAAEEEAAAKAAAAAAASADGAEVGPYGAQMGTPKEGPELEVGNESFMSPSLRHLGTHSRRPSNLTFVRQSAAASPDVPFEQRPALVRTVEGMSMFETLDRTLARFEATAFDIYEPEAGPSSRPMGPALLPPIPSASAAHDATALSVIPQSSATWDTHATAEMHGAVMNLKSLGDEAHTNALDVALRLARPVLPGREEEKKGKGAEGETSVHLMDVVQEEEGENGGDGGAGGEKEVNGHAAAEVADVTAVDAKSTSPSNRLSSPAGASPLDQDSPSKKKSAKGKEKAADSAPFPNPLEATAADLDVRGTSEWGEAALPRTMPDAMAWWTACSTDNLIANGIPAISSSRSEVMLVPLEDAVDAGVPSHRKAKRRRIVKSWRSAAPAASHSTATTSAAATAGGATAGGVTAPPVTSAAHPEKDPAETSGDASVPPENRSPTDDQEMEGSGTGQNGTVSREGIAQAVGANGRGPETAAGPAAAAAATLPPASTPAPAPAQPVIGVREVRGMRAKVEGNIATIMHLRKIHRKFGALATASEIEAPLPTWLKTTSSDEESDDPPSADEDSADEDASNAFRSSANGPFSMPPPPEGHTYEAPFSKLTATASRSNMRTHVQTLLAHVGFEGSHAAPVDVLTHVASDFLLSMGRTLRLYADRCAQQMSAEEMILHSIRENGAGDVPSLEAYVKDDVERYGIKLTQLLGKLRQSYKDQLNSADRGVIQDDALFADDGAAFQSGFFMDELGDDYLGFKALGLDQELGVSGLSIPSRLFHGRSMGNRAAPQGSASAKENVPFPPPPTFIPLSSGGITLQIGLLQDWYRQRLRERKEEARLGREDGDPAADPADDEDDEDGDDDDEQVRGILADEEPEKTRIKVPPTGRIPRRTMWDPAAKDAPAPTLVHADGPGAKGLSELSGKDVSNAKDGGADGEGGMGTNGKKRKGEIGGGDGEATPGKGAKKKKKKIMIAVA